MKALTPFMLLGLSLAVIRRFDMRTGAPAGEIRVEGAPWLNDLEVADDRTIYATQTGDFGNNPDPTTWRVWKIAPDGAPSVFVQGAPLQAPNGVVFDPEGNVVVANFGNAAVLTFSPSGERVRTEEAAQPGSDGLLIMPDGNGFRQPPDHLPLVQRFRHSEHGSRRGLPPPEQIELRCSEREQAHAEHCCCMRTNPRSQRLHHYRPRDEAIPPCDGPVGLPAVRPPGPGATRSAEFEERAMLRAVDQTHDQFATLA